MIKTYTKGEKVQLSKNFVSTEFDCNQSDCCTITYIDLDLVQILQKIRDHFGKSVNISSAYRCPSYNRRVGGASKSYHVRGQAADIKVSGVSPLSVAQYAESLGVKGIGHYDTFVHIDTRTSKFYWYSDAQIPKDTFQVKQQEEVKPTTVTQNLNPTDKVQVIGNTVNLREGPGTSYKKDGIAKKNQVFSIAKIPEDWIPIQIENKIRFISKNYVKSI